MYDTVLRMFQTTFTSGKFIFLIEKHQTSISVRFEEVTH